MTFYERIMLMSLIDWAGAAGLWAGDTTPIDLPTFRMYKNE